MIGIMPEIAKRPDILYKYMDPEGGLGLLEAREHWLKNPLSFPDKFDCRADLFVGLDTNEMQETYLEELVRFLCEPAQPIAYPHPDLGVLLKIREQGRPWSREKVLGTYASPTANGFSNIGRLQDRFRRGSQQLLGELRVLCLTGSPSSIFMWDNYAEKGEGICVGFRHDHSLDSYVGAADPVQYHSTWPPIATPREWARELAGIEAFPFGQRAKESLWRKLDGYRYEEEWRCISTVHPGIGTDDGEYYRVPFSHGSGGQYEPDVVVEVLLGHNISDQHEAEIRRVVAEHHPGVPIRWASLRSTPEPELG